MADRSEFSLHIDGIQLPPSPYGQSIRAAKDINKTLLVGNGDDQMSRLFAHEAVLGAGATLTLNLTAQLDRFGNALSLDDIAMIYVENVNDPTGGGTLEVRPNAANGFTNLLGALSAQKLPLGAFYCVGCFTADKFDVTAANRVLDFVETTGVTPILLRVIVFGRQ